MQKLSVVVVTLNAASQLKDCLESVVFADEVVVVDSGSTDGTVVFAQEYGARVIHQDWLGFGPQKQFAVAQATFDWVLCLDADERVSEELQRAIVEVMSNPCVGAYRMARCNRFLGRYLRHGEGYPDWSLRLFDRRCAQWSNDAVHEKVLFDGLAGMLGGDLLHESCETLESYLAKQNRYTTLQAEELYRRGRRSHAGQLVLSPVLRFVRFYLLRLGFLDGVPGLVHTLIGCFNSFAKYAKLIALEREKK